MFAVASARFSAFATEASATRDQILAQIQATAQLSQRNLSIARSQIQQKEKDRRIVQLTISEIGAIPRSEDVKLYKGVGKM